MIPANIQILFAIIISFICFITDIRYAKIFNKVTFPAIIIGLFISYYSFGTTGLKESIYGLIIGIFIEL